jgi:hypothetical protein
MIDVQQLWSEIVPNWLMAIAALVSIFQIVRGYFELRKAQRENELKIAFQESQLAELQQQTKQFEFQTYLMSDNNRILERGLFDLAGIIERNHFFYTKHNTNFNLFKDV